MECTATIGIFRLPHFVTSSPVSAAGVGARRKQTTVRTTKSIRASHSQSLLTSPSSSSLYDVLSVPQNGSSSDIKTAYRRMARKYHPDVCPASQKEECTTKFLQIQQAYDTLSDPLLREDYDWRLQNMFSVSEIEGRLENNCVWEAQLMELIRRRSGYNSSSWGNTMRTRNEKAATATASACG